MNLNSDSQPLAGKSSEPKVLSKNRYGEPRVCRVSDSAYWIEDLTFYVAPIEDDEIQIHLRKEIDAFGLDDDQLVKYFNILDFIYNYEES